MQGHQNRSIACELVGVNERPTVAAPHTSLVGITRASSEIPMGFTRLFRVLGAASVEVLPKVALSSTLRGLAFWLLEEGLRIRRLALSNSRSAADSHPWRFRFPSLLQLLHIFTQDYQTHDSSSYITSLSSKQNPVAQLILLPLPLSTSQS